jgi:hypothetical protein
LTINGSAQAGPHLSEAQLTAFVEGDLNQDQQTDIMVGRPVGLSMEVDGATWRVLVQPMADGLVLRGTREGLPSVAPSFAPPVAPPPVAPPVAPAGPGDSFGLGVPLDDDDDAVSADTGQVTGFAPVPADPAANPPTPPPGSLDAFERRAVPQELARRWLRDGAGQGNARRRAGVDPPRATGRRVGPRWS